MQFTFIIPTYNNYDLVNRCVASLKKHNAADVLVVDDGSKKKGTYEAPYVRKKHQGEFSATVNYGLKNKYECAVLCNDDIIFTENVTKEIERCFQLDPLIGIVGMKLYFPNGVIQHGGIGIGERGDFINLDLGMPGAYAKLAEQTGYKLGVTGAMFAIRKECLDDIGLFSEEFPMAYEDCEYCVRAWVKGWRVYYTSNVSAIHFQGWSRGRTNEEKKDAGTLLKEQRSAKMIGEVMRNVDISKLTLYVNSLNANTNT